jgi:hypothetical protein
VQGTGGEGEMGDELGTYALHLTGCNKLFLIKVFFYHKGTINTLFPSSILFRSCTAFFHDVREYRSHFFVFAFETHCSNKK